MKLVFARSNSQTSHSNRLLKIWDNRLNCSEIPEYEHKNKHSTSFNKNRNIGKMNIYKKIPHLIKDNIYLKTIEKEKSKRIN